MMLNYKSGMDHRKVIESLNENKKIFWKRKRNLTAINEGHKRSNVNDKQIFESKCGII
jgi:hypothetical protein